MSVIDNILLCGYLREYEEYCNTETPQLVTTVIAVYLKQPMIHSMGLKQQENESNISDILNTPNILKASCNELNVFKANVGNTKKRLLCPLRDIMNITLNDDKNNNNNYNYNHIDDEIIDIKYGSKHTLFLTSNGSVYAMGTNDSGQCGMGENIDYISIPTLIPFECKIKSICCGSLHSLFIDENGKLLVCGYNYCGQLGIGEKIQCEETQNNNNNNNNNNDQYKSLSNITVDDDIFNDDDINDDIDDDDDDDIDDIFDVNAGFADILESESDDNFNWSDDNEQFECIYKPIYNPYFEENNILFIDAKCGDYHSLCITTNGECYTFGHNGFGNLGNGTFSEWGDGVNIPYKLKINKKFINASCGKNHNVLITEKNEIVVFGDNANNQCSKNMKKNKIEIPYILSKKKEFGISENCFIENIICINNETISIIDIYKRCTKTV